MNPLSSYYQIKHLIKQEKRRQNYHIELIASENFVSKQVLKAAGSVLTNKYAEGYPKARYYGGCEFVDQIEEIAIEQVKQMFDCQFANVQPHSGSSANFAIFMALVPPGGKVLGMDINAGGHLSHGTKISFSGKLYEAYSYGVDQQTHLIDYEAVAKIAHECQPHLIIAGASNYSRQIDFAKFREIADAVGAYLLCDVAHIAGLIVSKQHPNCFPHCHVMMTTTHKTLRGPRGAIIAWNDPKLTKKINSAVFPGAQGGPLMHIIAAKAIAFSEALNPKYLKYGWKVVNNAKAFSKAFLDLDVQIITGGTDNHLFTIDVFNTYGITADLVEGWLEKANITTNKNTIPFDTNKPKTPSGLRLGTAAMTTQGFKPADFIKIAQLIHKIIKSQGSKQVICHCQKQVIKLLKKRKWSRLWTHFLAMA